MPAFKQLLEEEALAALTKRFQSPRACNLKRLCRLVGINKHAGKKGNGNGFICFPPGKNGNETYFFPATDPLDKKMFQHAWLLAPYDAFIMRYKNKQDMFFNRDKINPAPGLLFDNTIIFEGRVAGYWQRTIRKNSIDIAYHLHNPFNKKQSALVNQVIKKISKFIDLPVQV